MALKWTSTRNERLLLLIVKDVKINGPELARAWARQFPEDDFQPTARAITEQLGTLKKKAGGNAGGAKAVRNGVSTPSKPRSVSKAVPTPRNSAKKVTPSKRKNSRMSEESSGPDDDDDDSELDIKNFKSSSRASLGRSTKVPKRYRESDSEDDKAGDESDEPSMPIKREGEMGEEVHIAAPKAKVNGVGLASKMNGLMANGGGAEKTGVRVEIEDDSDISDFEKMLAA